jgi:hypothetical protein
MPRIEMRAEHHQLVRLVGARDLAHHVERHRVFVERVLDLQVDRDRLLLLERPDDAAVVLDSDGHGWNAGLCVCLARAATADENGSASSSPRADDRQNAFVLQELRACLREARCLTACARSARSTGPACPTSAAASSGCVGFALDVAKLLVGTVAPVDRRAPARRAWAS